MLVRTLAEITDGPNDVRGDGWRARRHFVRGDGLGFSLSETTVEAGREMHLWYKHHQEACFVMEGSAELTERDTGAVHRIGPGDAYAPGNDRHTVRVLEPLRLVCVFSPALTGQETHDADGSYLPAAD
ncbi:MAG TPA: ectoine synthase [Candidatus Limnocylindria bacterium]|nr:ectoine synthase [Candidatus Limnocylindria bacterium]